MKVAAQAKALAGALNLASALAADNKLIKKIPALGAVHLVTEAEAVRVIANNLDHVLELTLPATVEVAGEIAISSARLAALASGFPADAEIKINLDGPTAGIACGRSRFRLPTLPVTDLPLMPAIDQETGRAELTRDQALALFGRPLFAVSTEQTRFYLNGCLLHDAGADLVAVCTDGHRLGRVTIPGCGGLSRDYQCIVPLAAIKVIVKLLKTAGAEEPLTLRRSKTLLEIAGANFVFASKLIDAQYPTYERILPKPSGNSAVVDRAGLVFALERIKAVAPETKVAPMVGLLWTEAEPLLHVCIPGWPDLADDQVAADTAGHGKVAFKIAHGLELLDALAGDCVHIDAGDSAGGAIIIVDPDDTNFTAVQMPCVVTWGHADG